jgi:hypothetical protein
MRNPVAAAAKRADRKPGRAGGEARDRYTAARIATIATVAASDPGMGRPRNGPTDTSPPTAPQRENLMRLQSLIIVFLLATAPALAGNRPAPSETEDCPLGDRAAATTARGKASTASGGEPAAAPVETRANEPRSRSRWHSLLPGMMK